MTRGVVSGTRDRQSSRSGLGRRCSDEYQTQERFVHSTPFYGDDAGDSWRSLRLVEGSTHIIPRADRRCCGTARCRVCRDDRGLGALGVDSQPHGSTPALHCWFAPFPSNESSLALARVSQMETDMPKKPGILVEFSRGLSGTDSGEPIDPTAPTEPLRTFFHAAGR